MDYETFLAGKQLKVNSLGKTPGIIHPVLFDHQRDTVSLLTRKGRGASFKNVGLGKTVEQAEWVRQIDEPTIMLAPLAVAQQTSRIASNLLGMDIPYVRSQSEVDFGRSKFWITNYEMVEHFDISKYSAVVCDESSIMKHYSSKTFQQLTRLFEQTPYKLCCTATPSPNDYTELGNHAEFLGIMRHAEMIATFFTYNASKERIAIDGSQYKLKEHGKEAFYRWLASWAVAMTKPSDLGYSDEGYDLPELNIIPITVPSDYIPKGQMFALDSISATDANKVRRSTIDARHRVIRDLVNNGEQWLIWTGLNQEADDLGATIKDSYNLHGSLDIDDKIKAILDFQSGDLRVMVSKSKILGTGMNFQEGCHNMIFDGINYSWEQFYQSVGRVYRFGQKKPVNVYVIFSEQEEGIWRTIQRKGEDAMTMMDELVSAGKRYTEEEIRGIHHEFQYSTDKWTLPSGKAELWLGDSCHRMEEIPDNSVDLSIYSPPFPEIFVYTATEHDLCNSKDMDTFFQHYSFIIQENLRITKPGRIAAVHVADGRMLKQEYGFKGRRDFSGHVIEAYQAAGWVFWQRITVDKNPQVQAIRMKDDGLLFKTLKTDSMRLSGGHPDYILLFKKKGENAVPVLPMENDGVTSQDWINWAHPVWYDIKETNVLNAAVARSDDDNKHMCPLQLDLIERLVKLYSNPGELVFSPFGGIGSEICEAIRWKRRGLGIELKPEYYETAKRNIENYERKYSQRTLFDYIDDNKNAMHLHDKMNDLNQELDSEKEIREWNAEGYFGEEI